MNTKETHDFSLPEESNILPMTTFNMNFSVGEFQHWAEQNQKSSVSYYYLICKLDMQVHIYGSPLKTSGSVSSAS